MYNIVYRCYSLSIGDMVTNRILYLFLEMCRISRRHPSHGYSRQYRLCIDILLMCTRFHCKTENLSLCLLSTLRKNSVERHRWHIRIRVDDKRHQQQCGPTSRMSHRQYPIYHHERPQPDPQTVHSFQRVLLYLKISK